MLKNFLVAVALFFLAATPLAAQQAVPLSYQSESGAPAGTLVAGAKRTMIKSLLSINTTGTLYYLKFYNTNVAPTCGAGTPSWVVPVPFGSGNAGGGVALAVPDGLAFPNGLGFCLTGGIANNDTTPAATGVIINLGVSNY